MSNINAVRLSLLTAGMEEVFCGICTTAENGKVEISDDDREYVEESIASIKEILDL